jgi:uncharacterized protein (TIGR02646 family)
MIPLKRDRACDKIPKNFRGRTPIDRLVDLMKVQRQIKKGAVKKHKFDSKWSETKKQLQAETGGKCAYCEATTTESMHGDVEHYRPKSEYWWLAYVYDNYLASCQLCNQKYKKAAFTVAPGSVRMKAPRIRTNTTDARIKTLAEKSIPDPLVVEAVREFEDSHRKERPLILNPYIDDPTRFFAWEVIEGISEVRLVPNADNPDAPAYVEAADSLLGLNRDELLQRRYAIYSTYKLLAEVRDTVGVPPHLRERAAVQIAEMFTDASKPYAGMIRFFENSE